MKKISVIIPCYNVEQYLDRCYQSLIHQTIGIENLELIFVNDASPDHSLNKLIAFESEYPDSIIVINSDVNLKQGGARNLGLSYASADYIGYVDPDDWVDPTMFEKLYSKAIQYDADVVSCECNRVFSEDEPLTSSGKTDAFYIIDSIDARRELYIVGLGSGGVWSKIYKKNLLIDNQIFFPEHLAYEDNYFVSILLMYVNRYYKMEESLYHYFVNYNSTIIKQNSPYHFDRLDVAQMTYDELRLRGFCTDYSDEIEFKFLLNYYCNSIHVFLTRFQELPLSVIRQMNQTVRQFFPDYSKNPYLELLSPFYKKLIEYLPLDLSDETWQELMVNYQKKLEISFHTN